MEIAVEMYYNGIVFFSIDFEFLSQNAFTPQVLEKTQGSVNRVGLENSWFTLEIFFAISTKN